MAITLSGDGISSDAIASLAASKLTGQVADANAPSGSVIQVVGTFFTTAASSTSRTFADISGFSASITPISTSSKILVIGQLTGTPNSFGTGYELAVRVTRNGTSVGSNTVNSTYGALSSRNASGGEGGDTTSFCYLDSPSSLSALTYQVQFICGEGVTYYINQSYNQAYVSSYQATGASSIILLEIAG
jgi:hypothetical protein